MKRPRKTRKLSVPKRKRLNCLENPFRRLKGDLFGLIADYVYYSAGPKQLAFMLIALGSDSRCEDAITFYAVKISRRLEWSTEDAGAELARRRIVRDALIRRLQNFSVQRCLYCGKKEQSRKNPLIECGTLISRALDRPATATACRDCWLAQHPGRLVDPERSKCDCSSNCVELQLSLYPPEVTRALIRHPYVYCEQCVPGSVYGWEKYDRLALANDAREAFRRFDLLYKEFGIHYALYLQNEQVALATVAQRVFFPVALQAADSADIVRSFLVHARNCEISGHAESNLKEFVVNRWERHAKEKFNVEL